MVHGLKRFENHRQPESNSNSTKRIKPKSFLKRGLYCRLLIVMTKRTKAKIEGERTLGMNKTHVTKNIPKVFSLQKKVSNAAQVIQIKLKLARLKLKPKNFLGFKNKNWWNI